MHAASGAEPMLYLGTCPNQPEVAAMLSAHDLGLMCQPKSNRPRAGWIWAADNGCFAAKWDVASWLRWLDSGLPRAGCLFATVPDVVADHRATLALWRQYAPMVSERHYPLAFVGQDGATAGNVPWDDLDCWFVGGSTAWKQSEQSYALAVEARERGKWVHVGRVNSLRRLRSWTGLADSADGTFLAYGPKVNQPKVAAWLAAVKAAPSLFGRHAIGIDIDHRNADLARERCGMFLEVAS